MSFIDHELKLARAAGAAHRADWIGPNGDGSLGSLSLDFVFDGAARDYALLRRARGSAAARLAEAFMAGFDPY